jgi:hypothetical protein
MKRYDHYFTFSFKVGSDRANPDEIPLEDMVAAFRRHALDLLRLSPEMQRILYEDAHDCIEEELEPVTTEPRISAVVHDDHKACIVEFDARPWFEQATDEEIFALRDCALGPNRRKNRWGGAEESDWLAEFCEDYDPKIGRVFGYIMGRDCGFECYIKHDEAIAWIRKNRPHLEVKVKCPQCGQEACDVLEDGTTAGTDMLTHVEDHGMCLDCFKRWQGGEE